jgi:hypothetical protein
MAQSSPPSTVVQHRVVHIPHATWQLHKQNNTLRVYLPDKVLLRTMLIAHMLSASQLRFNYTACNLATAQIVSGIHVLSPEDVLLRTMLCQQALSQALWSNIVY